MGVGAGEVAVGAGCSEVAWVVERSAVEWGDDVVGVSGVAGAAWGLYLAAPPCCVEDCEAEFGVWAAVPGLSHQYG